MLHRARLLALFFLLGLTISISAQSPKPVTAQVQRIRDLGAAFSQVNLFEKTPASDVSAARFAQGAQFLILDENRLAELVANRPKSIALILPFNSETLVVDLVQTDILSADFSLAAGDSEHESFATRNGLHYRGVLRGAENAIAAFSFYDNEVMGVVSDEQYGNLVLGKVQSPGNRAGYMLYPERELAMDNPFECHLMEETAGQAPRINTGRNETAKTIRIYLEADYQLYRNRGSVQATLDYLTGVFNLVAALYANEQIDLVLSKVMVWATPDDYTNRNSDVVLEHFRQNRRGARADLAQLVGLAGANQESAAYLDVLCQPEYAAAYSKINVSYSNVPAYSWAAEVIAHEMGHNLGARHTQWCGWTGGPIDPCQLAEPGCPAGDGTRTGVTVMSYCPLITSGINFSQGFGALPGDVIRNSLLSAPCMLPAKTNNKSTETRSTATMSVESMQLSPNPANKQVSVQMSYDPQSQIRIALLDLVGRTLHTQTATRGDATINVDLSNLQKGVYLVQVFENDNLVATKRLIKN